MKADDTAASYDELPYSDRAFVQMHPDRTAMVARLHGLHPPPVETARVLELGCGPGGNLLPMAATLPNARFVGIDISERHIDQAQTVARNAGLSNIEFRRQDLLDYAAEGPGIRYDYVLCHGVYSWVPPDVRARILQICREGLSEDGLAVISYNTFPGWRFGAAVRDVIRHGARGATRAVERVTRGLEFLRFVAYNTFEPDSPYTRVLREAADALPHENPTYVYHEYLEDHNEPISCEAFVAAAQAAGLRYAGDTGLRDPSGLLSDEARTTLTGFAEDTLRCEQTLDFLQNRRFRSDILCRREKAVTRWPQPEALRHLLLRAAAEPVPPSEAGGTTGVGCETFRNSRGQSLTTADTALRRALHVLHGAQPLAVGYEPLAATIRAEAGAVDEAGLARALLACAGGGLVELHTMQAPVVAVPPVRPVATSVARWQAAEGKIVVNLWHQSVQLDALARFVLALLDGTRNRDALAVALADRFGQASGAGAIRGGACAGDDVCRTLDELIDALARMGLVLNR